MAVAAASGQAIALAREADGSGAVRGQQRSEPARLTVDPALVVGLAPIVAAEVAAGRVVDAAGSIELPAQGALIVA